MLRKERVTPAHCRQDQIDQPTRTDDTKPNAAADPSSQQPSSHLKRDGAAGIERPQPVTDEIKALPIAELMELALREMYITLITLSRCMRFHALEMILYKTRDLSKLLIALSSLLPGLAAMSVAVLQSAIVEQKDKSEAEQKDFFAKALADWRRVREQYLAA
jgi:hypothetical protein